MSVMNKLEECRFFLTQVQEESDDPKINSFYQSAFLSAWRSLLEYLLYDYAEYYGITKYYAKLEHATSFKTWTDERSFRFAAKDLENNGALKFIRWWVDKRKDLSSHELYTKKIDFPVIILPRLTSGTFSLRNYGIRQKYYDDRDTIIANFQKGLTLMENLLNEAERRFRTIS